jgi:hypothetical protein
MVRSTLIRHLHQDLINTWLSRLRQEGEFIITSKSTFQRRSLATNIGCPRTCCILNICYILVVTVILVFVFYFEIHTYIVDFAVDYWKIQLARQNLIVRYLTLIVGIV